MIGRSFNKSAGQWHGYINRGPVSWYRKNIKLLPEWKDSAVYAHFEGVYHKAEVWVEGKREGTFRSGYLPIVVRLDDKADAGADGGTAGDEEVTIALRVDARYGSGHWYEGGGIRRPAWLEIVPKSTCSLLPTSGGFLYASDPTGEDEDVVFNGTAWAQNLLPGSQCAVKARFTVRGPGNSTEVVAAGTTDTFRVDSGRNASASVQFGVSVDSASGTPAANLARWSVNHAALY